MSRSRMRSSPSLFMSRVSRHGSQSPRRHEVCSYTDNEAEARVPPLAPAEEDSLAPFGIGEEVRRAHETQGASHYSPLHSWMDRRIIAATTSSLARSWPNFFGQATVQRVCGTQPGKHDELSNNSDASDTADTGRRSRETSTSFEMQRLIGAPHLLSQSRTW